MYFFIVLKKYMYFDKLKELHKFCEKLSQSVLVLFLFDVKKIIFQKPLDFERYTTTGDYIGIYNIN